jgi:hypothetical protein
MEININILKVNKKKKKKKKYFKQELASVMHRFESEPVDFTKYTTLDLTVSLLSSF